MVVPPRYPQGMSTGYHLPRKVDVRLPGKGNSNPHGARPVHLIITTIMWIWTSRSHLRAGRLISDLSLQALVGVLFVVGEREEKERGERERERETTGYEPFALDKHQNSGRGEGLTSTSSQRRSIWAASKCINLRIRSAMSAPPRSARPTLLTGLILA